MPRITTTVLCAALCLAGVTATAASGHVATNAAARARMEKWMEFYTTAANKVGKGPADKVLWLSMFTPDGILNDPANSTPFVGAKEVAGAYDGLFANLDTHFSDIRPDWFSVSQDGKSGVITRIQLVSGTQHRIGPKVEFHFPAWIRYELDLTGADPKIQRLIACWDKIGADLDGQYDRMGWRKYELQALNAKNAVLGLGIKKALAYSSSISDTDTAAKDLVEPRAKSLVEWFNKGAAAAKAGDTEGHAAWRKVFVAIHAADATVTFPNASTISGKDAIGALYEKLTTDPSAAVLEITHTFQAGWRMGLELNANGVPTYRVLMDLRPPATAQDPILVDSLHVYADTA